MLAILSAAALGANLQVPAEQDRRMIADAQAIVRTEGDHIWAGLSQAPLPLLLVEQKQETLFCALPTVGFSVLGFDPVTRCSMQVRSRELPVDIAAASDLGDVSVIQLGLPAALEATAGEWTVTFLHESFHQYQNTLPGYRSAVEELRSQLRQPGSQWMLEYPFPYSDPKVKAAFTDMTAAAVRFLNAGHDAEALAAIREYVRLRHRAKSVVGSNSWTYYEFQVGQEGVARWTELEFAAAAGSGRPDIAAIAKERAAGLATSLRAIEDQGLHLWKRNVFYVLGAVEAAMLEKTDPSWKQKYAAHPFSLGAILEASTFGPPDQLHSSLWQEPPKPKEKVTLGITGGDA